MITHLLDEVLAFQESHRINCYPGPIPSEMLTGETSDDWAYWKAIPSTVTKQHIDELAAELGIWFSEQYRQVLQHRHFIDLHIGQVSLFSHPSTGWQDVLRKQILNGYPKELLFERGYMPFADFSDWGLWCFGLNEAAPNGEHAVYLWDHEQPKTFEFVAKDLSSALQLEAKRKNE